ncbi:TfuA-like protein [Pseudovibrio sp. W64]|uniref:TfuA-like protein n=1 Tax=Pseudovibrio sp. W64 TaxID=1735583 RepID=UPI0007B206CF|nr:TfuA-like protein [Pseudovibrio sp. W64]KZK86784.1 TfuA-like protein [Pseudovibrio sp. W64]
MSVFVFLGPSLALSDAQAVLDATYLPPASQGDVYRAVEDGARMIGIIDGYFEQVPSVWHKEILWAMSRGVHVYGAASMGALRAAELATFGMTGVGKVFQAYHEGRLEDDDEVAIAHGPAELGYPKLSEAMVNIRATLDRAESQHVICKELREFCEATAKSSHFPERSYKRLLSSIEGQADCDEIETFRGWLLAEQVDVKRDDALEMLQTMASQQAGALEPKKVSFAFAHTDTWEKLIRQIAPSEDPVNIDDLLDELRLDPKLYAQIVDGAIARALSLKEADRVALQEQPEKFQLKLHSFFVRRNLVEGSEIQDWLHEQELSSEDLISLIKREQRIETIRDGFDTDIRKALPDVLRAAGKYGSLVQKVESKKTLVPSDVLEGFFLNDDNPTEEQLLSWHFTERLKTPVPVHIDSHIAGLGLKSRKAFLQTLVMDYLHETALSTAHQVVVSEATS